MEQSQPSEVQPKAGLLLAPRASWADLVPRGALPPSPSIIPKYSGTGETTADL